MQKCAHPQSLGRRPCSRHFCPQERIARTGTALASGDDAPARSRVAAAINRLNAASAPSLQGQVLADSCFGLDRAH